MMAAAPTHMQPSATTNDDAHTSTQQHNTKQPRAWPWEGPRRDPIGTFGPTISHTHARFTTTEPSIAVHAHGRARIAIEGWGVTKKPSTTVKNSEQTNDRGRKNTRNLSNDRLRTAVEAAKQSAGDGGIERGGGNGGARVLAHTHETKQQKPKPNSVEADTSGGGRRRGWG